ncbi:hypothetical protein HanIR_Chr01g0002921 [Helianthus annuus]|nr:hypothetical protein HanIR_Chr01g0002921 [Helianthus annuus]KAJ0625503.1 hypothetical protein HanHA89_Chr01g0002381 [Helianthus annuus]KAJ0816177.1 hypothetical protein HanLR1_Chr00c0575g0760711 [Helianthus annuus]
MFPSPRNRPGSSITGTLTESGCTSMCHRHSWCALFVLLALQTPGINHVAQQTPVISGINYVAHNHIPSPTSTTCASVSCTCHKRYASFNQCEMNCLSPIWDASKLQHKVK